MEYDEILKRFEAAELKTRSLTAAERAEGIRECLLAGTEVRGIPVSESLIVNRMRAYANNLQRTFMNAMWDVDPMVSRVGAFALFTNATGDYATQEDERELAVKISSFVSDKKINFLQDVWVRAASRVEDTTVADVELMLRDRFALTLAGQPVMTRVPEWAQAGPISLNYYPALYCSKDEWDVGDKTVRSSLETGVLVAERMAIKVFGARENQLVFDPVLNSRMLLGRNSIMLDEALALADANNRQRAYPNAFTKYQPL